MLAILCHLSLAPANGPSLRAEDWHLADPIYFAPSTLPAEPELSAAAKPALPLAAVAASQPALELPAKPQTELAKPAEKLPEADAAKAEAPAVAKAEAKLDDAQVPDAQANAAMAAAGAQTPSDADAAARSAFAASLHSNFSHGGMHHQINSALPVFTPDPPILHASFPEPAKGKDIVMNVVINEEGSIVAVQVLQGVGYGVENAIVETLRRWVYVPAKVNGMAIVSQEQVRFHFPG